MEALLNEDMEACWQVALKYTPEAAHSDILLDIMCNCSSVMCNFIRRVQLPCQEFPRLLAWLTSVAQGQQNDFIADVCRLLCEKMLSAPATVDNFTFKVWTWFHADLQDCAETGVVPYNLHAFIADANDVWLVDSQYVEGCNGVLKKVVTVAPNIHLPMISSRTTVKRLFGLTTKDCSHHTSDHIGNLHRWSGKEEQAKACAERHEHPSFKMRLDHLTTDPSRWSVLDPVDTPLDEYAPAPAPHVMTKAQRQVAAAKGIDQRFAGEMLCAVKDLYKARDIPWLPTARVALETLWAGVDGGDEGF